MCPINSELPNPSRSAGDSATGSSSGTGPAGFSIRRPVTICMMFVSVIIVGLISVVRIPLVLFPDVDEPFLNVRAPYRNATPGQIQESITKPLEEVLSTVPGVQRMSAYSSGNSASVRLVLDWDMDVDVLRAEAREKIEQIRDDLPADLEHVWLQNWSTDDIPIIDGRIASGRDLRKAAEILELKIKKPLERVPGVADVDIWGTQHQQVDIYLRLEDIKRFRVDVSRVFRRLDDLNLNRSVGPLLDGSARYNAITQGTIKSVEELYNLPVNSRGLTLADIADIEYDTPLLNSGQHLNGRYAVGFTVRKTSQANTVQTVNRVMTKIEEMGLDPSLEGIELLPWRNTGEEITKSLKGLFRAGAIGALLAGLVLFLFLRKIGATAVIVLSIPFSIIAAVGFLYLTGSTLNVLTMLGLMLATGMLVDNAVVVLESIYTKLEKGVGRIRAAVVGTQEVTMAVVAATLTSIIIFVPLVFGKQTNFSVWLSYTGIAIIFALLSSLFASLTLIPLAMGRLLQMNVKNRAKGQQRMSGVVSTFFSVLGSLFSARATTSGTGLASPERREAAGITGAYLRLVLWPLQHRLLVGLLIVPSIVVGSAWLLVNKIADNSPEAQELGNLQIQYEFSENFHYAKIEHDYVLPVEQFLLDNKERFKINDVLSRYGNDRASSQVYFDRENITLDELEDIRREISEGLPVIPGAEIRPGRQRGAQSRNWIGASLYGDDPTTLQALAGEAKRKLLARPDFTEVYTQLDRAQEEVQIRLRRALARKYGVSAKSVADVVDIVVRGRRLRGYRTPDGEVDIMVRLLPEDRDSLDDLRSVVVGRGVNGQEVLLSQVADLKIQKIPGELNREDRRTHTELWAVYSGEQRNDGMTSLSGVMDSLDYPPGTGWSYGFWTQRMEKEDQDFLFNILLALFMVYFVMASLFESVSHPFAIMFSLPFAVVGIAGFLYVTQTPFNLMAKIGILVLIGIVVNNGIVLIDHINNLRRGGMARSQAIQEGCRERFRPIVMTASTTIVGLIPLAFSHSSLFDMRYFPMARTVMGGLLASTILTLVVLPTYYTLFDDLAIWTKRTWYSSQPS